MRLDNWIYETIKLNNKLSREELEKYQLNALNNLIKYVKENSFFYREIYKDLDKINSLEEIYKIPIISKEDIIKNGNKMVCVNQREISRITSLDTSGTTGKYKRIYFTEEDQNLTLDFFIQGLSFLVKKDDVMMIMFPFKKENSVGDLIKQSLEIMNVKFVLNGNMCSFKKTTDFMISKGVNSIVGMPIEILALGRYIKKENLPIKIKSILLSGDMVNNTFIEEIKKIYNCKVFNHYGMTETGLGCAIDCDYRKGMHIRENDLLVEIINPVTKESIKEGDSGEILITTLTRKAMPLIRYATGDISSFSIGNCSCNSILKRLSNIQYRMDDRVHIGKNLYININSIDNILYNLNNLINSKLDVESKDDYYELKLQVVFFKEEKQSTSYINDENLKRKIKRLLLSNPRIMKSYEMGMLKIKINIIYTDEYINLYKGKRKIISI